MSISADTLKLLLDAGLSGEQLLVVVRSIEADHSRPARSTNAERQARFRAKRRDSNVTNNATDNVTPPPIDNNHTPPVSSQPSVSKKAANQFPPPDGVEDQLWGDFLANRKRHKAPLTRTAYDRICKTLIESREAGYPPGEVVGRAVERGWRTVFNPAGGEQNGSKSTAKTIRDPVLRALADSGIAFGDQPGNA